MADLIDFHLLDEFDQQIPDGEGGFVFKTRPEQLSLDDMERIIFKHAGANDTLLNDVMIPKRLEDVQWDWLYLEYFLWDELPEPKDPEPVRPNKDTVAVWKILHHEMLRAAARPEASESLRLQHEDHVAWTAMMDAIIIQYPDA